MTKSPKGSAGGRRIRYLADPTSPVEVTSKARTILKYAHESADGFLKSFAAVRRDRGATKGTTTDEEQDLLRAILVFAAAGLDSTLKQLIRDTLPTLVRTDPNVKEGLETFVERQLRGDAASSEAASGRAFLAKILTAEAQLDELIEQYILSLTGSSLQSPSELAKAAQALGVTLGDVGIDQRRLRPMFNVRNKIIHELDINLDAPIRNRESRSRDNMVSDANALLEVGEKILVAVETKIQNAA